MKTHNVKNTLVINGWKVNGPKKQETKAGLDENGPKKQEPLNKEREHDFLLISDPLKTVIHIEAKHNTKEKRSAAKQLESGIEFFKQALVFPPEEGWKFVRIMYFEKGKNVCSDCPQFVFNPETDLDKWWKVFEEKTMKDVKRTQQDSSLRESSYIQNCKYLLHQMFQQSQIITKADISKNSEDFFEKSCNSEMYTNETEKKGICFLTRVQFSLYHDPTMKRVVFKSAYGTGKTILIKSKAKELAIKGEKVIIVLFDDLKASFEFLLKKNYDQEFNLVSNVKVALIKCAGTMIEKTQ